MKKILILIILISTTSLILILDSRYSSKDSFIKDHELIMKEVSFGIIEVNPDLDNLIKIHVRNRIIFEDNNPYIEKGAYFNHIRRLEGIESVEITGSYEISIIKGQVFSQKEIIDKIIPLFKKELSQTSH
jgi:hypothetical protein